MDQKESLKRRRESILEEAERRGFEAVAFFNEIVGQNPSNTVYVLPMALGDEHQTFVMDTGGDTTLVTPHWGAPQAEESGEFSKVIAIKQEKGHHIEGTREALKPYGPDKICFDLSTLGAQMAYRMTEELGVPVTPERDISDHVFRLRSIKDEYEVAEMRRAIEITEAAVQIMIEETSPGRGVADLKRELDSNLIGLGAYGYSFESSIGFIKQNKTAYLKHGDALSVDVGVTLDGLIADSALTMPIGVVPAQALELMDTTRSSLEAAIEQCRPGGRLGDISHAVQEVAEGPGFSVVRSLVGHGVGREMHEDPQIPNFGEAGRGPRLEPGMVFAIEPMVNVGGHEVYVADDGWSIHTCDGTLSAHFEHTVAITDDGPRVLTRRDGEEGRAPLV